jgi:ATP-dependent DNA ligase
MQTGNSNSTVVSKIGIPDRNGGRILYADHIDGKGAALYQAACQSDMEGIVAKYKWGAYCPDPGASSWIKIKNRHNSQASGRARAVHPLPPARCVNAGA